MDWLHKASSPLKKLYLFTTFLLMSFITACGSGGFNDSTGTGTGTGTGGTTDTITISLSISDTNVTAVNPATISATVSGSISGPQAGVVVTFSTSLGVLNPASGTALTDGSGVATIEIHPGTVEGAGTVTASVSSGAQSEIGFATAGDGTDIAGKVVVVTSTTTQVSSATPATLTATVTDGGVAVAGEVVTFTTSIGVLDPESGTALTNAAGQATIALGAGIVEGAGLITATTSTGESNTLGFETAGDGTVRGGRAVVVSIDNTSVDAANPRNVTATVTDDGTPVANTVVTFTSTLGVLDPISGTALTNASGQATIILAAGTVEGAGVVTGTLGTGEAGNASFTTEGDGTVLGGRSLVVAIDNPNVDAANPRNLTATLLDAGTPVPNEVVTFTTTMGVLDPISGTALTNASGQATIILAAGTVEGAGVVTATVATGEADTVGFNTAGDGTVLGGRSLVVTIDNPNVNSANPRNITATLLDAGTPVPNEVVTFTTTLGVLDPISGTALTNASGQATIILAAGTVEGAGVVTATVATGEADTLGFHTDGDGTVLGGRSLVVTIDDPNVNAANPRNVTATLLDAGTPVQNEVVTFTTTLGVLDPISGTALTDASGQATIIIAAGTVQGAGVITATVATGEADTQGFSTAGDGTDAGGRSIAITISDPSVSNANPRTISATVTDPNGSVAQQVVTFTTTLGNLNPASGTALTDGSGVATIVIEAGSVEGAGVVTGTLTSGEADTLGFYSAGDGAAPGKTITLVATTAQITQAAPGTLTATVLQDGAPVVGEIVTFSANLGVLNPISGTAATNASGVATIALNTGNVPGTGIASVVAASGESASAVFSTAGDGPAAGRTISLAVSAGTITDAAPGTLTATVLDDGNPAPAGEIVSFTTSLGFLNPVSGVATTNASGIATIALNAGNTSGTGVASASISGQTSSALFTTAGDGAPAGKSVALGITAGTVTDAAPATLTATVTNNGTPVEGEVVTFTSTLGELDPVSGLATTNASGVAQITLNTGTVAGTGLATVTTSTNESNTVTFATAGDAPGTVTRNVAIEICDLTFTTCGFTVNDVSAATARALRATVTEGATNVEGEVVQFTTTTGALDPVSGSVLTNAAGQATITLTAGSVAGAGTATATIPSGSNANVGFSTAGDVSSGVSVSLDLQNSGGTSITQINRTTPGTIVATVTGISQPVIVTFSSDLGSIPIQTAITDGSNQASVDIFASDSLGAGTITATLVSGETAQFVFSIGASSLGIGTATPNDVLTPTVATISAGGTTNLPITIWDTSGAPVPFTDPVDVTFSSTCSAAGLATIDSPVTTVNGLATATYQAQGCEITDTITATANAGGVVLTATGSLTVTAADVGSLQFMSATPENITLQGTGGAGNSETSIVKFKLLDATGAAMDNEEVCANLNTTIGGITVTPTPTGSSSCPGGTDAAGQTDANGEVNFIVNAGTVATTVRLTADATVGGTTVTTQSSNLIISTGIPDQDSFSLSADILNPEGWSIDGNTVEVTARLADAFNNPVPDGTTVQFTTEGGTIQPSCNTTGGACSVTWTSTNVRPDGQELGANDPEVVNTLGQSYGGRATVTATAIGNESFPDLNGNGLYDASELAAFGGNDNSGNPFNLPEAFEDYNEDGIYDIAAAGGALEKFMDFNSNGTYDDGTPALYNGILCAPGNAANCDAANTSINVRGNIVIVMSDSNARFVTTAPAGGAALSIAGESTGVASIIIADFHNQPMPAGTTVEFTATVGSIVSESSFTWPNDNHNGGRAFAVTVKGETTPKSGSLIVKVTTPSGVVTQYTVCAITIT